MAMTVNCPEGHPYIQADVTIGALGCPVCREERRVDLLWAGGFFDGEGCISLMKRKDRNNQMHMRVTMANTEREPIDLFLRLFGGYTYIDDRKPPRQPIHFWHVANVQEMKAMLDEIIPYLRVKREQAEIALAFQNRRASVGHRRANGAVDPERDEADFVRMKALKRGVRAA